MAAFRAVSDGSEQISRSTAVGALSHLEFVGAAAPPSVFCRSAPNDGCPCITASISPISGARGGQMRRSGWKLGISHFMVIGNNSRLPAVRQASPGEGGHVQEPWRPPTLVASVRGEPPFAADELQSDAADEFGGDPAYTGRRRSHLDLPELR